MDNRTILEIFLTTTFVVSICGLYIHYKYVFKPMREESKRLQEKLIKQREEIEKAEKRVFDEYRLTSEYLKNQIEKHK